MLTLPTLVTLPILLTHIPTNPPTQHHPLSPPPSQQMWGTKEYFAPEVVDQAYGPQADVWALGCVLYEMLTGEQAFPVKEHDTESKFYGRIQVGRYLCFAWI
ncbi:hypothetical protein EON64_03410 [archaeon]|nr:MAG: hypothetical protein EON64_03410 [archaeon]